jgi:hypothetical protein
MPVDFVIYNQTATHALDFWWTIEVTDLPSGIGACSTNSTGEFYGYWIVDDVLSIGNYKLNVTDATGNYMVTVPFAVGDVHVLATPRKASFAQGETITFTLEHSFGNEYPIDESLLKIYDPSGALVFSGDMLETWVKTGLWYTAPYSSQTAGGNPMTLADDAPTGTWSWKWIDGEGDTVTSGTLTVTATAADQTQQQIQALAAQVTAVSNSVTQLSTTVSNVASSATAASNAATAASTAAAQAATAAQGAATTAGQAATAAQAALAAAQEAKTSADNAASAASGLTTLVYAAIGASLVAALAAIVALMQISRKIA